MEREFVLLRKLEIYFSNFVIHVDLVSQQNAGDGGAESPHFFVPSFQVLVGDFSSGVEHQDAAIRLEVVARVQTFEALLPSGVPNVYL